MTSLDSFDPPQANPPVRQGPRPPAGGGFVVESARMAWRWLTRMRTALYLLGVLGLLTLVATAVPQQPNVPATVASWRAGTAGPGAAVASLLDVFGAFDMYGSALFLALLLLLFLSLTACLIPRLRAFATLARRARPPRSSHLGDQPMHERFVVAASVAQVETAARTQLRRWRLRATEPGEQIAAERGLLLREGGSLLFHVSFYVLLVGIVTGQLLGFTGQVGVIEGQAMTDTQVAYWSAKPGRWWGADDHRGFTLSLDAFTVDWHRDPRFGGRPKVFESEVTITRADGTTFTDTVGGNDPLIVDGMKIHQLGWGYAPRVIVTVGAEVVHDAYLTANATSGGFYRTAVKAPAADPDVGLQVEMYPYAPEGEDGNPVPTGAPWADAPLLVFEEFRGNLRLDRVQNVSTLDLTELESQGGGALRLGQTAVLPDGVTVTFLDLKRWVGFQVSRRPTTPLLLTGALLLLVGLLPALYAYRRRLWVEAEAAPEGGGTLVTVAGRAFQRPQAFEREFAAVVAALRALGPPAASDDRTAADPSVADPDRPLVEGTP